MVDRWASLQSLRVFLLKLLRNIFHFAPCVSYFLSVLVTVSPSTHCLPLQVISSWLFCYWTCWSTRPHPGSSTCHRQLTTWARFSLMTWAARRTTTPSEPTHRASWPMSCLPESWPKGLRVGFVFVTQIVHHVLYICRYVSFCACFVSFLVHKKSICISCQCESLMPQPQPAPGKKQSKEKHVCRKHSCLKRIYHCSANHTLFFHSDY